MTWPFGIMRKGAYGVIYCDFPWQFRSYNAVGVPQTAADQHYPTMTVQQGARLPVAKLGQPDCALFMWCMSSHTEQMFWLCRQWGFEFSSKAFCWAKLNPNAVTDQKLCDDQSAWFMGMGHGSRRNTEDCWLFTRGQPQRTMINKDGQTVPDRGVREFTPAPVREHSRKPDEIYHKIERLYQGPYVELFSRSSRPGWSSWGNQTDKFG